MIGFIRLHKNIIIELTLLIAAALSVTIVGINVYILIFSVVMHELGHIIAALLKGARADNFAIHGFGVEITFPGKTPTPYKMLFISTGGPIISLLISILAYKFNYITLFTVNISIAFVNLIPAYPLDGGNILSCLLSGFIPRSKIHKVMKYLGKLFGAIITLCGICVLFVSTFNISLLYMGLFVFFSANKSNNPVVEVTSADYSEFEKSSLFVIDESMKILDAADNLPVNSVGAVKDKSGKITSFVTPLYLYELSVNDSTRQLKNIEKSRP